MREKINRSRVLPPPISLFGRPSDRCPPPPSPFPVPPHLISPVPVRNILPQTLVPHHQHHVLSDKEGGYTTSSDCRELFLSSRCSYAASSTVSIWRSLVPDATDRLACFSTIIFSFPSPAAGKADMHPDLEEWIICFVGHCIALLTERPVKVVAAEQDGSHSNGD